MAPRRTIMGMVRASGTDRHHAAFHRIFSAACWSMDAVGLAVFDLVTAMMSTVFLTIDDTLIPRTGLKIFGTGMHRDPLRIATQVCRFFKAPERDVLVIAVEHLRGGRGTEVFSTTDVTTDVETVLRRYSWRWSIEMTFHDTKQHLGIEAPQNRTCPAAHRTAPTAFLLYSLIVWWHEQVPDQPAPALLNWRGKRHPSFADMLSALRAESLQNLSLEGFSTPPLPLNVQKLIQHLTNLFQLAT